MNGTRAYNAIILGWLMERHWSVKVFAKVPQVLQELKHVFGPNQSICLQGANDPIRGSVRHATSNA
jgi:hypothetical protein